MSVSASFAAFCAREPGMGAGVREAAAGTVVGVGAAREGEGERLVLRAAAGGGRRAVAGTEEVGGGEGGLAGRAGEAEGGTR